MNERLDQVLRRLDETIESQAAEIERLKDEYLKLDEKLEQALRKNENQATLITELCDALVEIPLKGNPHLFVYQDLIGRAREGTR